MTGVVRRLVLPVLVAGLAGCAGTASPTQSTFPSATFSPSSAASSGLPSTSAPSPPPLGWRRLAVDGPVPEAREDHTWTPSADGPVACLFGGRDSAGRSLDDLWAYDLATDRWQRIDARGPRARFGHSAAWVDGIGLVIFAGQGPNGFFNDLWAYDPDANRWRELPAGGDPPVARYGSCAAVGPDGRFWISHGFTSEGARFADTRAYDFATQAWTDETPAGERPVERCLHSCWWTDDGALALYAGQTTGVAALDDLWHLVPGPRIGTNAWSELTPPRRRPPPRQLYASARWGSAMVVFGGGSRAGGFLADTWLIGDDGVASRLLSGEGPAPRLGAEMAADPDRQRLLLFGGRDGTTAFDDLWELALPAP